MAALRPVRDVATVDLDREGEPDPGFKLTRLLNQFRRPLLLGLVLVVIDALATLAGPILVKTGVDGGVSAGSEAVLFGAAGVFLLITLIDMFDEIGETFVTGRAAERIMLSLRIRIWAQLQRLSLDYYEREMAGRIMTRMTTDVDQFESLIENGVLSALVALVTFVGVAVAGRHQPRARPVHALGGRAHGRGHRGLPAEVVARLYDLSRERIAIVNADFQESLSGVRESQAFVHEAATKADSTTWAANTWSRGSAAQRLVAVLLPLHPVPLGDARTPSCWASAAV